MTFDVLQVIHENPSMIKLSHISSKSHIGSSFLRDKILSFLLKNGFIEETTLLRRNDNQRLIPLKTAHPRISWKTTEKGRRLLEAYKDLRSLTIADVN